MARTRRVPAARPARPVTATGAAPGLSGYRYLLAVVMLVLVSSGSVLALIGVGVSSLGQWPEGLPAPLAPAVPPGGAAGSADPFITFAPVSPASPESGTEPPPPCHAVGVWQLVG
jgi:hypothetical protein